ncbi:MAG TPA: energy transducer TonB, partial [Cytophagales bacterium]|nr:energy transducer TonB [Cytophagales bacterium]
GARAMGVEGKVYVKAVVGKDGKLTDIELLKGIGSGCDEEALR